MLKRHGYPDQLVRTVGQFHEGTTATFLANGYASQKVLVTSGIRQEVPAGAAVVYIGARFAVP
ncbi:hypothetical protein GQ600_22591 [Phytophthora cactorum]|uniref:Uncharacterized protein n=1 Tax=Phytophthora cactorum TaxID=29920 RepID=A0A8T1B0J3_9STRA|nr:hypothetical protein GQ600_22591 [Phytophthora cactorum]KAG2891440.1 hypothetical protein PC117_g24238 [Phytophthora cactorum]